MIEQQNILIISGPSGVGKSTIAKKLVDIFPNVKEEVSCTTRPKREGETDGVEYHFVSREDFMQMLAAGEFFESSEYNGNLYGTRYSELEEKTTNCNLCIMLMDIPGTRMIKQEFPGACAVYLTAPIDVLEARLRKRGTDNEDVIQRRLESAEKELYAGKQNAGDVYNAVIHDLDLATVINSICTVFEPLSALRREVARKDCAVGRFDGTMLRLTEYTGERWIGRLERLPNGTIVGDRMVYARLAEYENLGLLPDEIFDLFAQGAEILAEHNRNAIDVMGLDEDIVFWDTGAEIEAIRYLDGSDDYETLAYISYERSVTFPAPKEMALSDNDVMAIIAFARSGMAGVKLDGARSGGKEDK